MGCVLCVFGMIFYNSRSSNVLSKLQTSHVNECNGMFYFWSAGRTFVFRARPDCEFNTTEYKGNTPTPVAYIPSAFRVHMPIRCHLCRCSRYAAKSSSSVSTSLRIHTCFACLRHKSKSGVFGAGVTGEGTFSMYEGRDIELDPAAPVTVVLSVAFIPPEEGGEGGAPKPCVNCFLVDDLPQTRRQWSRAALDDAAAVFMECVSPKTETVSVSGTSSRAASTKNEPSDGGPLLKGPQQPQQPLRKSTRASTVAHSKVASKRARPQELSPPSTRVPLEDADTVLLVGDHPVALARTASWLQKSLGKEAVILGGVSSCALVVGDQVRWRVVGDVLQGCGSRNRPGSRGGVAASILLF